MAEAGGTASHSAHSLPGMIEINTSAEEVLLPLSSVRSSLRYHAPLPVDFHSAQCFVTAVALNRSILSKMQQIQLMHLTDNREGDDVKSPLQFDNV